MGSAIAAMPASWEVQDKLSPPQLDLRSGFSRGKRLREGIGVVLGWWGPPTCLCLSFPHSHCCRQGLRAGDALCWGAGSGRGARLWEPRDGSEEEPGTSASPATPATGVTSPPCWPPETSCLLHPANQAASGASTKRGKAPTGMGIRGVAQPREGLGMVPRCWVAAASHGWAGCRRQPCLWWSGVCLYAWICACLHTCAVAARPASVSPQFGAALGALPGLNEPARGDGAAALLPPPPQSVRSLPGDTAARKVAGRWQAGCDSE